VRLHGTNGSDLSLEFVNRTLDELKPDLAVLSGDNIHGPTSPDQETAYLKLLSLFSTKKQPFAIVFGNHDDEGHLDRQRLMDLIVTIPYNLATHGPASAEGVGNYVLEALSDHGHPPVNVWFLDSHAYVDDEQTKEDWIREGQLKFVEEEGLKRQSAYNGVSPVAMSFQHIPLPEYHNYKTENYLGLYQEGPGAPKVQLWWFVIY
jgi:predicted MPP superfamily phosphohydrolase